MSEPSPWKVSPRAMENPPESKERRKERKRERRYREKAK
jgi:hypothetical protein